MMDDDTEIRNVVLARDALRREAHLPPLDIEKEVEHAQRQRAREKSADTFYPHAIIICERSVPTSIMSAGLMGISNLLRLNFDLSQGEQSFIRQSLDGLKKRLDKYEKPHRIGLIPYFDAPRFIVVNYSPTHAIRYDLNGGEIETYEAPITTGYGSLTIDGARAHLSAIKKGATPSSINK